MPGSSARPEAMAPAGLLKHFQVDRHPTKVRLIAGRAMYTGQGKLTISLRRTLVVATVNEPLQLIRDDVLDNITLYWFTNKGISSGRLDWENKFPFFDFKNALLYLLIALRFGYFRHSVRPLCLVRSWRSKIVSVFSYESQLNFSFQPLCPTWRT